MDSDAAGTCSFSKKDGRMRRILSIGAAQLGPIERSGDRAGVVQLMLDLHD
jgi:hypothetical protein